MTAYTPNLPALITALPGDQTRAPQEPDAAASIPTGCCPQCAAPLPGAEPAPTSAEAGVFTRARQVAFLENLSVTGSVRSAASAAGTSHQTAYRTRRSTPAFRIAWDAALVVARVSVADTVGCRAIDGVTEEVRYHGEVVGTRTRYSDRLLLAHLARLDRLAETPAANAFADIFDEALARFERGEEAVPAPPEPEPAGAENFSPGPCNTRSMSPPAAPAGEGAQDTADACADACAEEAGEEDEGGYEYYDDDEGPGSPEDYADLLEGESAAEARMPVIDRLLAAMERRRPADAPDLTERYGVARLEQEQLDAFVADVERWWLVIPRRPGDDPEEWRFHEEEPE